MDAKSFERELRKAEPEETGLFDPVRQAAPHEEAK